MVNVGAAEVLGPLCGQPLEAAARSAVAQLSEEHANTCAKECPLWRQSAVKIGGTQSTGRRRTGSPPRREPTDDRMLAASPAVPREERHGPVAESSDLRVRHEVRQVRPTRPVLPSNRVVMSK